MFSAISLFDSIDALGLGLLGKMLSISPSYFFFYLPLIVTISIVFGATRHEDTRLIILHSFYTARWITGFMAIIFGVLALVSWLI